jgi:hypothetical protein
MRSSTIHHLMTVLALAAGLFTAGCVVHERGGYDGSYGDDRGYGRADDRGRHDRDDDRGSDRNDDRGGDRRDERRDDERGRPIRGD